MTIPNPEIKSLFIQAIEIESPEERAKFLEQACGENSGLRREIEGLLSAHEEAGSFMKTSPSADGDATELHMSGIDKDFVGTRIGPYKLLQQLGEGGMGTVYLAEQHEPVRRRVALKVIKPGMDTRQVIARFEAERQALAMMDHHHIAHVLDAGATEAGRPYFVMELVKGVPITEYCDRNKLTLSERLELFVPVCQAIQHAHQKGIIHRDVKPSNVLVALYDGHPVPKVIDFGVAKAIDTQLTQRTMFTHIGQIVGTMEYMSPEQAEMNQLDVDTRSDIYSLGVLLYELLTGSTPITSKQLKAAGFAEMLRTIRESEPPKPSTRISESADVLPSISAVRKSEPAKLSKLLRGELDWIVMKALEKDRTRRYETANGLAADIGHFLSNEAVEACPPSAAYKFRKFASRNKTTLAVSSALASVLVLGAVISTWQAIRAIRAERLASARLAEVEQQRDRANQERDRAERETARAGKAEELAETRLAESEEARGEAEAVSGFLTESFRRTNPDADSRLITVVETLSSAAEQLEGSMAAYPMRKAKLQLILGSTFEGLGLYEEAIRLLEQSHNYQLRTHGERHTDTLDVAGALASAYSESGNIDRAISLQEQIYELRKEHLGPEHDKTVKAMNDLAISYSRVVRRQKDAIELQTEVMAICKKKGVPKDISTALNNLAAMKLSSGDHYDALELLERALEMSKASKGPNSPATLAAMVNLAMANQRIGRKKDQIRLLEQTLELQKQILGPEHSDTLHSLVALANVYNQIGSPEKALKLMENALELRRKTLGDDHPDTLFTMHKVASYWRYWHDREEEAIELQEQVVNTSWQVLGPGDARTLNFMRRLVEYYKEEERHEEAEELFQKMSDVARKAGKLADQDHLETINRLANFYADNGRIQEAIDLKQQALEERRTALGDDHKLTLTAMSNLADLCNKYESYRGQAIPLGEQVVQLRSKTLGEAHWQTLAARRTLSTYYESVDRWNESIANRSELLDSVRKQNGKEHHETLVAMGELAVSLGEGKRYGECFDQYIELIALRQRFDGPEHSNTLRDTQKLANYYRLAGRFEDAINIAAELHKTRNRILKTEHYDTRATKAVLIQAYARTGRHDELLEITRQPLTEATGTASGWRLDTAWHNIWWMAPSPDHMRTVIVHAVNFQGRRGVLTMVDAATGEILWQNQEAHTDEGDGVSFSHDGTMLVSSGDDGRVRLWNSADGTHIRDFEGFSKGASVLHAAFSPDDQYIAAGGGDYRERYVGDHDIRLWKTNSGKLVGKLKGHTNKIRRLVFGKEGKRLYSCSTGGIYIAWDLAEKKEIYRTQVSDQELWAIVLSPDGKTLATGDNRGAVQLWSASDGKLIRQFEMDDGLIWGLAFSADGRRVAAGTNGARAWVWDVETGDQLAKFSKHQTRVSGIAFAADGESIISGDRFGYVYRWPIDANPPEHGEQESTQ